MRLNKKQILHSLGQFYGVKVVLTSKYHEDHAHTDLVRDIIYICYQPQVPLSFLLSSFFHELSHLICKYTNKYPIYHEPYLDKIPKYKRPYFYATMWRAEKYVDKMGEKLMKTHFPSIKFHRGYQNSIKPIFFPIMKQTFIQYFKEVDRLKRLSKK